jgi:hypothetical protein
VHLPSVIAIKSRGNVIRSPQRYYFNKNTKVVGITSHEKGDYIFVRTRSGIRVWNECDVKEIDYREFMRCSNATVPDNVPRYYIKEWK